MRIVRRFALYRRRTEPNCFVPDPAQFPNAAPPPKPCILSGQQILALLQQAGQLKSATGSPLRAAVYRLAVVLLHTAGLRRGEPVRLRNGDNAPSRNTLLVRLSRFCKSRMAALSGDALREASTYLQQRQCFPHTARSPLLAHGPQLQKAFSGSGFDKAFRKLRRDAAVLTASGAPARVHSVRHTHAVHVLLRCYRENRNPQACCRPCRGPWAMPRWPRPRTTCPGSIRSSSRPSNASPATFALSRQVITHSGARESSILTGLWTIHASPASTIPKPLCRGSRGVSMKHGRRHRHSFFALASIGGACASALAGDWPPDVEAHRTLVDATSASPRGRAFGSEAGPDSGRRSQPQPFQTP